MIMHSYVFIIGAGAGKPYGFPVGDELYRFIRDDYPKHVGTDPHIREMADGFSKELSRTSGVSVDKYLNINLSLKTCGVHSIPTGINFFECESRTTLPPVNPCIDGDWYTYLYKKMIQGLNTPEELLRIAKSPVSFITFNYDRSLEYFLFSNLYGLLKNVRVQDGRDPKEKVAELLTTIPFVHVYGKVGYLEWETNRMDEIVSYGFDKRTPGEIATQTSKMIDLIYDERKDKPEIRMAKELISKAQRVVFLGFGYDEMNLSILGLPHLLKNKQVFGTAFKSTENERNQIRSLLKFDDHDGNPKILEDCDCLMMLRKHLV